MASSLMSMAYPGVIYQEGWVGVASRAWRVLHITAMCTWSLGVGGHPQHRMLACCTSSACCWFILMSLTCYTPRLCLPVCVRVPGLKIKRVHTSIRAIVCSRTDNYNKSMSLSESVLQWRLADWSGRRKKQIIILFCIPRCLGGTYYTLVV